MAVNEEIKPKILSWEEFNGYFKTYSGCKEVLIDLGKQLENITSDRGSIQETYKVNQKINETIEIAANAQSKILDHLMLIEYQRKEKEHQDNGGDSNTQQGNKEGDNTSTHQGQV